MNRIVGAVSAFCLVLLFVAACGDAEPGAQPATPLPAAAAAPAPPVPPAPAAVLAPPAPPPPALPALAAIPAVELAPLPTSQPAHTLVTRARLTSAPTPTPTALPPPAAAFKYTVVDGNGNEVTFDRPPERVVAFDSAAVEILFAIGEGGRVVGTHDFLSYPPEADDIPRLGGAFNMNIEATVALEPDLVFIFFPTFLEPLENAGLKVFYQKTISDDFTRTADNIRMWGRIVGSTSRAESVAADFEARIERIRGVMAFYSGGPSVFHYEGALWTPGPDTLIGGVFELLKLENIAADVSGYAQLSPEVIVERDPQMIIASTGDTISGNPAFKNVHAVKNGRVLVPQSDALMIAGPRFVEGVEELARWAYPGLFR